MRWLVVVGVSIDLAGAALVGWSVYAQSAAERREEALTGLGGNFWVILFREEEQAYVRVGLSLLGIGFGLQLIGYVAGFGWPAGAIALLAGLLAAGSAFFIGDKLAGRAMPLELSRPDDRPGIGDERSNFGVETLEDVKTLRRLYASRMHGRTLRRRQHIVRPEISGGDWFFRCPDCGPNHVKKCLQTGCSVARPDDKKSGGQLLVPPSLNSGGRFFGASRRRGCLSALTVLSRVMKKDSKRGETTMNLFRARARGAGLAAAVVALTLLTAPALAGWGPATPNFNLEAQLRPVAGGPDGFGLVKFRQPKDGETIVYLDVWVRDLAPNHSYYLERATDSTVDDECTGTNWLRLGQGLVPQAITTDEAGTGRADLFRSLPPSALGTEFDIQFRVVDAVTSAVVLASACYQFTVSQ